MANLDITNNDLGIVKLDSGEFADGLITFAGADVYVAGTILAVDSTTKKYIAFVKGGVGDDDGIAKAVLTYDVTATGAGDIKSRVLIRGTVNSSRLVIDADGDDSNVDVDVVDGLRDFGITPVEVSQLAQLDNQ